MNPWRLKLTFRGVRGSIPTPHASHLGYGGNTTCLELLLPTGERFIFDAGTGVRELGRDLMGAVNLFFTHFHWDHIQGLPAFAPLFEPGRILRFHASRYTAPLREALSGQMAWPHFPVDFARLPSQCEFIDLGADAFLIASWTTRLRQSKLKTLRPACRNWKRAAEVECGAEVVSPQRGLRYSNRLGFTPFERIRWFFPVRPRAGA